MSWSNNATDMTETNDLLRKIVELLEDIKSALGK